MIGNGNDRFGNGLVKYAYDSLGNGRGKKCLEWRRNFTAMIAKGTAWTSLGVEKRGLGEETVRMAESSIGIA